MAVRLTDAREVRSSRVGLEDALRLPTRPGEEQEATVSRMQIEAVKSMVQTDPTVGSCLAVNRSYVVGTGPTLEWHGTPDLVGAAQGEWNQRFSEAYMNLAGDILDHIDEYGLLVLKLVTGVPSVIRAAQRQTQEDRAETFEEVRPLRDVQAEFAAGRARIRTARPSLLVTAPPAGKAE